MKIHLSRFVCMAPDSNLQRCRAEAQAAAEGGAELIVFPESFLHGYTRILAPETVRQTFRDISGDHPGPLFAFGSFTEGGHNRMTLWRGGQEVARYDKVHLFLPNGEAELWQPGRSYTALRFQDWTLGLLNCNDVRFPEQARALRLQTRCDLLLAVAWWPWRRDAIWSTLLRARAIENGVFTAGCCIAASEYPGEPFAGAGNHVFDPLGDPIPTLDDHAYALDRERLGQVTVDPLTTAVDISEVKIFPRS
jgi:predicted amidohydrolase